MQRPQAGKVLGTSEELKEGQHDWHIMRKRVAPDKLENWAERRTIGTEDVSYKGSVGNRLIA